MKTRSYWMTLHLQMMRILMRMKMKMANRMTKMTTTTATTKKAEGHRAECGSQRESWKAWWWMQHKQHYVSSAGQYVKAHALAMGQENGKMCWRRPVINVGRGWFSWWVINAECPTMVIEHFAEICPGHFRGEISRPPGWGLYITRDTPSIKVLAPILKIFELTWRVKLTRSGIFRWLKFYCRSSRRKIGMGCLNEAKHIWWIWLRGNWRELGRAGGMPNRNLTKQGK